MHPKSPKIEDIAIGQRIRKRRQMLGLSQERLGALVGITFQQIQKYEKGTNRIGGSRMEEIARVLECSPADFFGTEHKSAVIPQFGVVAHRLAEVVDTLSPRAQKQIAALADFLAETEGKLAATQALLDGADADTGAIPRMAARNDLAAVGDALHRPHA